MAILNSKVRKELMDLIDLELGMVNERAENLATKYWGKAEKEVCLDLGYGDVLSRIEFVKNQIEGLQTELNQLEGTLLERSRTATVENYQNLGFNVTADRYGHIYNRPKVFGIPIHTLWDTIVLAKLNETIPFFDFYKSVQQLHHVVKRELLLCGTFEDARLLYTKFHNKITSAIGDHLPGLLAEVKSIPALQRPFEDETE